MEQKSTEREKQSTLIVTDIKYKDFGIEYFFQPLQTSCFLLPFNGFRNKDLIPNIIYGTSGMKSVELRTSVNYHMIYNDAKKLQINENLQDAILKVGEPIFTILER